MDKNAVKPKQTPSWKFWTLFVAVAGLLAALLFSLYQYGLDSWLQSMLFPMVLSAMASIGVSLWFTIKSEKDRLIDDLNKEIDGVLLRTVQLIRVISEVPQNPLYSDILVKQILHYEFFILPDMYRIKIHYTQLWDMYKGNRDKMIQELDSWSRKSDKEDLLSTFIALIAEITDCALKVQDQYYQDYRGSPKRQIPKQLIHKVTMKRNNKT